MEESLGRNFPLRALLDWFSSHKRELPWRHHPSFYEVLISEFMLQQTGVTAVIPYYERWMRAFPTLLHLAQAELEVVIKLWEGLGYYSRARHLHAIAQEICFNEKPLPCSYQQLRSYKGIGDYTAKAILAFAYQKAEIALDGNVLRVGARFLALQADVKLPRVRKTIQESFDAVAKNDGQMAEALIELGALVCKKVPLCSACPLQPECLAYQQGLSEHLPITAKRPAIEKITTAVAVCQVGEEFLVIKQAKKLMKGLYEFPRQEDLFFLLSQAHKAISLGPIKRHFTRFEETLTPHHIFLTLKPELSECSHYEWIHYKKLHHLPFSGGHRTIREMVLQKFCCGACAC